MRQHIDSGGRPEELVQIVIQRVRQDPREATWKEAQVLLNELGRGPDGSALIRNPLVQKFIGEAARLSCREEG